MASFLRPNKASLKNAQHYEFMVAAVSIQTIRGIDN